MDTEKILENLSAMGCDEKEICFMKNPLFSYKKTKLVRKVALFHCFYKHLSVWLHR